MPSLSNNGQLLYCDFNSLGYRIAKIDNPYPVKKSDTEYLTYKNNIMLASNNKDLTSNLQNINEQSIHYDDSQIPKCSVAPYHLTYSKISFLPRIMFDYQSLAVPTHFFSNIFIFY